MQPPAVLLSANARCPRKSSQILKQNTVLIVRFTNRCSTISGASSLTSTSDLPLSTRIARSNDIIAQGFPVTLTYGFLAFVIAVSTGTLLGVAAAVRQNSWLDYLAVGVSIGAQVLPNFVMAPILVLVFTLWLGWLPGGGWQGGQLPYLVMPVIALSTSFMASIARITRSSMLEVLNADFILTARAKGLPLRRVIFRHALKPAMLPVISYLSPTFVGMITGSVVIDMYFSTGGIGQYFVNAAINRDYSLIMGITILTGALTVLFNLLADVAYALIDPRIRY